MRLSALADVRLFSSENFSELEAISSERLLFDANVWLLLQGYFTLVSDRRVKTYSRFFEFALSSGAQIVLCQTILSEFVNRAVRIRAKEAEWDQRGKIHHHQDYNLWIDDAANDVFHISKDAEYIDDGFSGVKFDSIVSEVKSGTLDFNDVLISGLCIRNGLTLVTDDIDFKGLNLPIISGNRNYA